MDVDERARLVIKIVSPFLVVGAPIALILYWRAPNPPGKEHVGPMGNAVMSVFLVASFVFGLYYCSKELGWFRRKK